MTSPDDPTPKILGAGRYELLEPVGAGGMARVWRARDVRLGKDVAIKVIEGEGRALAVRTRRLLSEARAMARLQHPHIVAVHDVQEVEGGAYVVMDLVDGGTLEERLQAEGHLSPRRVVAWAIQVLDALHAAHERGVIHRDVKPSNVLLDQQERALLADFGIALLLDEDRHTRTGISMGSVAYMAPEQRLDAKGVGPAADVYATACTIYHLLSGSTPVDLFTADADSPRWLSIPEPLRGLLVAATRLDLAKRPQTAEAFAHQLQAVLLDLPDGDGTDEAWLAREREAGGLAFGAEPQTRDEEAFAVAGFGTLQPTMGTHELDGGRRAVSVVLAAGGVGLVLLALAPWWWPVADDPSRVEMPADPAVSVVARDESPSSQPSAGERPAKAPATTSLDGAEDAPGNVQPARASQTAERPAPGVRPRSPVEPNVTQEAGSGEAPTPDAPRAAALLGAEPDTTLPEHGRWTGRTNHIETVVLDVAARDGEAVVVFSGSASDHAGDTRTLHSVLRGSRVDGRLVVHDSTKQMVMTVWTDAQNRLKFEYVPPGGGELESNVLRRMR